jgi:hypothetical protein
VAAVGQIVVQAVGNGPTLGVLEEVVGIDLFTVAAPTMILFAPLAFISLAPFRLPDFPHLPDFPQLNFLL